MLLDGLLLGAVRQGSKFKLASNPAFLNEKALTRIQNVAVSAKYTGDIGENKIFYGLGDPFPDVVALCGLGSVADLRTEQRVEITRNAAANGARILAGHNGIQRIGVDLMMDGKAAAEGALLGTYRFDEFKTGTRPADSVEFSPITASVKGCDVVDRWNTGVKLANAQNIARSLMNTPANHMTPRHFATKAGELLGPFREKIDFHVYDSLWAASHRMDAFLAVAKGSDEPPLFLEIKYRGSKESTDKVKLALVGKGITFDSGGISLKPSAGMSAMKGDMGGAAVALAVMVGVASLEIPLNVSAFIPLCENMPSGKAIKPGDVVRAMNGKTIEIDNTDAEGRLILADALHYVSSNFSPEYLIDIATLTGAIDIALGSAYSGVFSNNNDMVQSLVLSGEIAGDCFWRMPLHRIYRQQIRSNVADFKNVGGRSAGSCTAAQFLFEFIGERTETGKSLPRWAHIDIAGVMENTGSTDGIDVKGMSGRPTRSLIEYVYSLNSN